jgi:hypothetical protein
MPPGRINNSLRINKTSSQLILSWSEPASPCITSAYSIYRGSIPFTGYSYEQINCNVSGTNYSIPAGSGNYYFIVVAQNNNTEGSFGKDSNGNERPNNNACKSQQIGNCN